jgi:hypothetical protein
MSGAVLDTLVILTILTIFAAYRDPIFAASFGHHFGENTLIFVTTPVQYIPIFAASFGQKVEAKMTPKPESQPVNSTS